MAEMFFRTTTCIAFQLAIVVWLGLPNLLALKLSGLRTSPVLNQAPQPSALGPKTQTLSHLRFIGLFISSRG
jgi:hypothetical protein